VERSVVRSAVHRLKGLLRLRNQSLEAFAQQESTYNEEWATAAIARRQRLRTRAAEAVMAHEEHGEHDDSAWPEGSVAARHRWPSFEGPGGNGQQLWEACVGSPSISF
jgi:hypothetical protein